MPMTPKSSDYCPPPQKLAEGGHRDRMPMRETASIAHWRRVRESKRSPIDQSEALSGALRIAFASHAYNPRESRRRLTTHGAPVPPKLSCASRTMKLVPGHCLVR